MNLQPPLKLFTVESANRLLPAIQARLAEMRVTHGEILRLQGKVDIEEMTGGSADGKLSRQVQQQITKLNEAVLKHMETFEEQLEDFHALGCELKDLSRGLVDFYTLRNGGLAYLCWVEGENEIEFWHSLEGGFAARRPL